MSPAVLAHSLGHVLAHLPRHGGSHFHTVKGGAYADSRIYVGRNGFVLHNVVVVDSGGVAGVSFAQIFCNDIGSQAKSRQCYGRIGELSRYFSKSDVQIFRISGMIGS